MPTFESLPTEIRQKIIKLAVVSSAITSLIGPVPEGPQSQPTNLDPARPQNRPHIRGLHSPARSRPDAHPIYESYLTEAFLGALKVAGDFSPSIITDLTPADSAWVNAHYDKIRKELLTRLYPHFNSKWPPELERHRVPLPLSSSRTASRLGGVSRAFRHDLKAAMFMIREVMKAEQDAIEKSLGDVWKEKCEFSKVDGIYLTHIPGGPPIRVIRGCYALDLAAVRVATGRIVEVLAEAKMLECICQAIRHDLLDLRFRVEWALKDW